MKAKREEINKQCKTLFENEAKGVFARHPKLESFRWTQYTPHFNDGDTCEFSVNNEYLCGTVYDGEEFDELSASSFDTSKSWHNEDAVAKEGFFEAFKEIDALLKNFEEDDYKFMFGDHVEIKVTKGGIEVNEYEHD